jgi:hypothetical protein
MREEIGHHMNDETLECEVEVFLASYLPQRHFSEETYKAIFDAGVARARDHFKEYLPFQSEDDISKSLKVIVGALVKAGRDHGKKRRLRYSSEPNKALISGITGGNFKIDASLINAKKSLHTTNTIVAMEFKLHRNFDTVRKVSALINSCHHSSLPNSPHRIANKSYRR